MEAFDCGRCGRRSHHWLMLGSALTQQQASGRQSLLVATPCMRIHVPLCCAALHCIMPLSRWPHLLLCIHMRHVHGLAMQQRHDG